MIEAVQSALKEKKKGEVILLTGPFCPRARSYFSNVEDALDASRNTLEP
jgi:hypothetical protein